MKTFRKLFETHNKGMLDETGINELHRSLLHCYFHSKADLNEDELEYAEDLVFQLYAEKKLDEPYNQMFKTFMERDAVLGKKYYFQRDLLEAHNARRGEQLKNMLHPDVDEEAEEAKLREVLQEVFQKVHAEKETTMVKGVTDNFITLVKQFFQEFASAIQFNKPRLQWATAIASMVIIVGFGWFLFKPGNPEMLVGDSLKQPVKNDQHFVLEQPPVQKDEKAINEEIHSRVNDLLAAVFTFATKFDYSMTRGETTVATDSFILAADKYNQKKYDSCRLILKGLLQRNSFSNADTISEINYYLGNCYIITGMNKNNNDLIKLALQSFQRIGPQSHLFRQAQWYSVFALAKLGQTKDGLRLCDTLIKARFLDHGKVKLMRDSLQSINTIRPD